MEEPLKAIQFIAENSRAYAKAKAQRVLIENSLRSTKARLMNESGAKTLGDREAEAYAHDDYLTQVRGLAEAVEQEEALRWLMEAAKLKIECWKTQQFTVRTEMKLGL